MSEKPNKVGENKNDQQMENSPNAQQVEKYSKSKQKHTKADTNSDSKSDAKKDAKTAKAKSH